MICLITAVMVQTACEADQASWTPMAEQLEKYHRLPETMYADGHYGSDANVLDAEKRGVDLQSPVAGASQTPRKDGPDDLTIDDFVIEDTTQIVERCPNGCVPVSSEYDAAKGRTTTAMSATDCSGCAFASMCPVRKVGERFVMVHTPAQQRLAARRAEQATDVFRERYAAPSGGESLNSGLQRKTGMGRLRVRGLARMRLAVLLRCAGWNLLRALAALKKAGMGAFGPGGLARAGHFVQCRVMARVVEARRSAFGTLRAAMERFWAIHPSAAALSAAA